MSASAKSILVFGIYLVGLGVVLVLMPNTALSLVGLPATGEVWVRVVGMLLLYLAFFCIQAARKELADFFRWTVYTRSLIIVFFTAFVISGLVSPVLILFGVVDLLAAIWTGLALRSEKTINAQGV